MNQLSDIELSNLKEKFNIKLNELKNLNLKLDLTRGKPCTEQLNLSNQIESILEGNYFAESNLDCRNYGIIDGIEEAKNLFSEILEIPPENTLVGGNSSLTLMYQYISHAYHFGIKGPDSAWSKLDNPSFLCPSPGYDRHFAICEALNIKMIPVSIDENGPNMDEVENLIENNKSICGIWCVPKYSNPSGIIYSEKNIHRLALLAKKTTPYFRILWDNAYALHGFNSTDKLENIYKIAKENNLEDSVVLFGSTSKISFAGSGVAFMGTSKANLNSFKNFLSFQTIGPDKVNQLKHVKFFKDLNGIKKHMEKHAKIMQPKFDLVLETLKQDLSSLNFAQWSTPSGGYFISLNTLPGLAKKVINLCNDLGVKLTPAGSTYPYGNDPNDSNIRIAPSFAENNDIPLATTCLTTAIGFLSCENLLRKANLTN